MIQENKSYYQHLKERTVGVKIESMFVTVSALTEAMERVSDDWKRSVVVEPPDLDGFYKIRAVEQQNGNV